MERILSMVIEDQNGMPHKVVWNGHNYVEANGTIWAADKKSGVYLPKASAGLKRNDLTKVLTETKDEEARLKQHSKAMQSFFGLLMEFTEKVPNAFVLDMEGRIRMPEKTVMKVFGIEQKTGVGDPITAVCTYVTGDFHGLGFHAAAQAMPLRNPDGRPLKLSKKGAELINAACDLGELGYGQASSRWQRIIRNRHLVGSAHKWQQILDKSDVVAVREILLSICGIKCEVMVVEQK